MSGGIGIWTRSWCGVGKDEQDWSDLVVNAPPLYIQEKVHPKVLVDDLLRSVANSGQRPNKDAAV